jgi:hypothetical protein
MPIHVEIKVNDKVLNTLHIGRFRGSTGKDDVNTYLVIDGKAPTSIDDWIRGAEFQHRYGDGAEVCVMKAIQALGYGQGETMSYQEGEVSYE